MHIRDFYEHGSFDKSLNAALLVVSNLQKRVCKDFIITLEGVVYQGVT